MPEPQLPIDLGQQTRPQAADPRRPNYGAYREEAAVDFDRGDLYDGLIPRRVLAFWIDAAVLLLLGFMAWLALGTLAVVTFGLLSPLLALLAVVPIGYHSLFICLRGATPGMQLLDLEVLMANGRSPDFPHALVATVLFYVSLIPPAWLVLLVPLFNPRRRTLHDWLTGCAVVRRSKWRGA